MYIGILVQSCQIRQKPVQRSLKRVPWTIHKLQIYQATPSACPPSTSSCSSLFWLQFGDHLSQKPCLWDHSVTLWWDSFVKENLRPTILWHCPFKCCFPVHILKPNAEKVWSPWLISDVFSGDIKEANKINSIKEEGKSYFFWRNPQKLGNKKDNKIYNIIFHFFIIYIQIYLYVFTIGCLNFKLKN